MSANPFNRISEQAKVSVEISRLGASIAALETRISAVEMQRFTLIAALEVAEARLVGLNEDPVKADAKILSSLQRAKRRAEKRLERAEEMLNSKKPRTGKKKNKIAKTGKARASRRKTTQGES